MEARRHAGSPHPDIFRVGTPRGRIVGHEEPLSTKVPDNVGEESQEEHFLRKFK